MQSRAPCCYSDEVSCGSFPEPRRNGPANCTSREPAGGLRPATCGPGGRRPSGRSPARAGRAARSGVQPQRVRARGLGRRAAREPQRRGAAQPGLDHEGADDLRRTRAARAGVHLADARLGHGAGPQPGARRQPRARGRRRPVHDGGSLVGLRQRAAPGGPRARHRRRRHRQQPASRTRATTAPPSTTVRTAPTTSCRTR